MRSAPLVNAVGSYRIARTQANAWFRATMLIALIPEVAAVAAVARGYFLRGGLTYGIHISSHQCDRLVSETLIWKSQRAANERPINREVKASSRMVKLARNSRAKDEIRLGPDYKAPWGIEAEKLSWARIWFDSMLWKRGTNGTFVPFTAPGQP